jgi:phage-related protein
MAETVKGQIGQESVLLENAATEVTLVKLLEEIRKLGGNASKVSGVAGQAGINPATIAAANAATTAGTAATTAGTSATSGLASSIGATATTLGRFVGGTFAAFEAAIVLAIEGFQMLYKFQQENFDALRNTANAGVTFGGALTQVRLSAANAYLELDKFGSVVRDNADVFSSMGGDAQEGVNQFVKIQNKLLAPGSETANNLATLGYSFADAADLTASFMRQQGSMNKEELKNAATVSKSVAAYAQELTLLSEISGKSREEIQKQMDKESMESQWKNLMAGLSPEETKKANQGLAQASLEGQGAIDYFKAKMMGFPPLTEQGQLYAATQRAGTLALDDYVKTTKDASISAEQASEKNRAALAKSIVDGAGDMNKMRTVLQASGLTGGALSKTLSEAQNLQTKFMKDGKMMSESEIKASLDKMAKDTERTKSEAEQLKESEARMKQFYASILNAVSPLLAGLTTVMNALIGVVTFVAAPFVAIGKVVADFATSIINNLMPAVNSAGSLFSALLTPVKLVFEGVMGGFKLLSNALGSIIGFALKPFIAVMDTISKGITTLWSKMSTMLDPIIAPIKALFSSSNSTFGKLFGYLGDFAGWLASAPFKVLFFGLGIVVDVLTFGFKVLGNVVELVLSPFKLLYDAIGYGIDFVAGIFEDLGDAISFVLSPFTMVGDALNALYDGVTGLLKKLNPLNWFSSDDNNKKTPPKMASGGIVNNPTTLIAGEAGPEAIIPLKNLGDMLTAKDDSTVNTAGLQKSGSSQGFGNDAAEILTGKLDMLNNLTQQMLRHMQDTADNTKKNVDATRSLNGNLFAA